MSIHVLNFGDCFNFVPTPVFVRCREPPFKPTGFFKKMSIFQTSSVSFKWKTIVSSFCLSDWDEEIMTSFWNFKISKKGLACTQQMKKDSKDVDAVKMGQWLHKGLFKTQDVSSETEHRAITLGASHWRTELIFLIVSALLQNEPAHQACSSDSQTWECS